MRVWTLAAAGIAAFLLTAGAAGAATTIIGSGLAAECSQAAQSGKFDRGSMQTCDQALADEALTQRDRAKTLINRGVMKMRRSDYDGALVDFNASTALVEDIGEAYVNRGATLIALRRYQEGLVEINRGIELGIEEPAKAYYNRALAYEGLEDARSAYLDYQQAVTLQPDWALPRQQLLRFTVGRR